MAIQVADLFASLGFKVQTNEAEILRAATKLNTFRIQMQRVLTFAAGATGVGALVNLTSKLAAMGDEIGKVSNRLGISTTALQEYQFAAKQAGIDSGTFNMALQRLERRAADAARGEGAAVQAFAELGVQLRDSSGDVKPLEMLFDETVATMSRVESQAERVRLGFKLFDSEGLRLVQAMNDGADGLMRVRQEARALGGVWSKFTVKQAELLTDNIGRLSFALKGLGGQVLRGVAPHFNRLAAQFNRWFKQNKDFIQLRVFEVFNQFGESVARLGRAFSEAAISFRNFWRDASPELKLILSLLVGIAAAALVISIPFLGVMVAIGIIVALIEDFKGALEGADSIIGDLLDQFPGFSRHLDNFIEKTKAWGAELSLLWEDAENGVGVFGAIADFFDTIAAAVDKINELDAFFSQKIAGVVQQGIDTFGNASIVEDISNLNQRAGNAILDALGLGVNTGTTTNITNNINVENADGDFIDDVNQRALQSVTP